MFTQSLYVSDKEVLDPLAAKDEISCPGPPKRVPRRESNGTKRICKHFTTLFSFFLSN